MKTERTPLAHARDLATAAGLERRLGDTGLPYWRHPDHGPVVVSDKPVGGRWAWVDWSLGNIRHHEGPTEATALRAWLDANPTVQPAAAAAPKPPRCAACGRLRGTDAEMEESQREQAKTDDLVHRLTARAEQAEATIARARALAGRWERKSDGLDEVDVDHDYGVCAAQLARALDGGR